MHSPTLRIRGSNQKHRWVRQWQWTPFCQRYERARERPLRHFSSLTSFDYLLCSTRWFMFPNSVRFRSGSTFLEHPGATGIRTSGTLFTKRLADGWRVKLDKQRQRASERAQQCVCIRVCVVWEDKGTVFDLDIQNTEALKQGCRSQIVILEVLNYLQKNLLENYTFLLNYSIFINIYCVF